MDVNSMDVKRMVFEGAIPIEFRYETRYYYVMASRVAYLGLLLPHVKRHLVPTNIKETDFLFQYSGISLKTHYPIGLLHDIYCKMNEDSHQNTEIPWRISLKIGNKSEKQPYLGPTGYRELEEYFMSMLKQADFMRHGSVKKIMNLTQSDQSQLWTSLISNDFVKFSDVNNEIISKDIPKYLPCRIYLKDDMVVQEPFCLHEKDNVTLFSYLSAVLPDSLKDNICDYRAITHGISIPLETSMLYLASNFTYCDNFLHIVVYKTL